jgi:hypothetical protein
LVHAIAVSGEPNLRNKSEMALEIKGPWPAKPKSSHGWPGRRRENNCNCALSRTFGFIFCYIGLHNFIVYLLISISTKYFNAWPIAHETG